MKWLTLIFLSLIWGSSFILIKKSLIAFTPMQIGLLRISISALALSPILYYYRNHIFKKDFKYILIVGLCGSGIPSFLYPLAQTHVDSSVAGVLNSLTPFFTFILGLLFFGMTYSNKKMMGVLFGLGGAVILIISRSGLNVDEGVIYSLYILLATICYAISVNTVNAKLKHAHAIVITALGLVIAGIPSLALLLNTDIVSVLQEHPQAWYSFGSVAALSLFGTALASMIFFYLVQKTDAVFGASVAYIIPVVALLFGLADGEIINAGILAGLGLILCGVYLSKS